MLGASTESLRRGLRNCLEGTQPGSHVPPSFEIRRCRQPCQAMSTFVKMRKTSPLLQPFHSHPWENSPITIRVCDDRECELRPQSCVRPPQLYMADSNKAGLGGQRWGPPNSGGRARATSCWKLRFESRVGMSGWEEERGLCSRHGDTMGEEWRVALCHGNVAKLELHFPECPSLCALRPG